LSRAIPIKKFVNNHVPVRGTPSIQGQIALLSLRPTQPYNSFPSIRSPQPAHQARLFPLGHLIFVASYILLRHLVIFTPAALFVSPASFCGQKDRPTSESALRHLNETSITARFCPVSLMTVLAKCQSYPQPLVSSRQIPSHP